MKTTKNTFLILLLTFFTFGSVFAGNHEERQTRNIKNFNAIKVSTGVDLYITQGNEEKVSVVADDDIINRIITEVENGTLHIYMKKKGWWFESFSGTRKVYVTVKNIVSLEATSGSDVKSENTIEGETLKIKTSSGSDVNMDVIIKDLSVSASSGSDAKVSGKSKNLHVQASSGSDISAKDLESVNCEASASSGADISVRVNEHFTGNVSSGADIYYYGNPSNTDIDESSGGDIHHR